MVTNTINPEYGRNSGAIIDATIKAGTNQFHGSGFDFFRDTSLNSQGFFQIAPEVFHRNEFGGTVGGPIRKDQHTFFFFSYQDSGERAEEQSGDCGCGSPGQAQVFTSDERKGIFQSAPGVTDIGSNGDVFLSLVGEGGTTYPSWHPIYDHLPNRNNTGSRYQSHREDPSRRYPHRNNKREYLQFQSGRNRESMINCCSGSIKHSVPRTPSGPTRSGNASPALRTCPSLEPRCPGSAKPTNATGSNTALRGTTPSVQH